jgi:hypothetical protein
MRIDASNLLTAQAARAPQRTQPPVQRAPEQTKAAFEPMDFSKTAAEATARTEAKPAQQLTQPMRKGSLLDIKI